MSHAIVFIFCNKSIFNVRNFCSIALGGSHVLHKKMTTKVPRHFTQILGRGLYRSEKILYTSKFERKPLGCSQGRLREI